MLYFCHVKILKRIINIVIWTVIALNLLTAAVLRLPVVQQSVGNKVSTVLSEALGTEVSVGRVDLGFLDRIIIDDVTILDQRDKPMLSITRLSAKIDIWPLTKGPLAAERASQTQLPVHHRLFSPKRHTESYPTRPPHQLTDHPTVQYHIRSSGCGTDTRTVQSPASAHQRPQFPYQSLGSHR